MQKFCILSLSLSLVHHRFRFYSTVFPIPLFTDIPTADIYPDADLSMNRSNQPFSNDSPSTPKQENWKYSTFTPFATGHKATDDILHKVVQDALLMKGSIARPSSSASPSFISQDSTRKATKHSQPLPVSNSLQPTPPSSTSTSKSTFASPNISTVIVRMIMSMSLPDDGWAPYVRLSINGNRQPDMVPQAITGSSGSEEFITVKFGTSSFFLDHL